MFRKLGKFARTFHGKVTLGSMLATAAGGAMADGLDITLITAGILLSVAAIGGVGAAVASGPKLTSATWKWIKGAIS